MAGDAITLLRKLLESMEGWKASDLFLGEGRVPALRVAGRVAPVEAPALDAETFHAIAAQVLGPHRLEQWLDTGDADAGWSLESGKRFRFHFGRQQGLGTATARALPSGELLFEDLGLPAAIAALADLPRGLVLVTGSTGSGKSTTLAAMIHHINRTRRAHIVTIEDPIEFVHTDVRSRITQREVGTDTTSFAAALRNVVRQSPDVILLGEMRDAETMQIAIQAALTGHLVLATLHTIDASQTLQRVLGNFPEHARAQAAMDLSIGLQGIVSQRLVPSAEGGGRVLAAELLTVTPPVRRLIRDQETDGIQDLMRGAADPGMQTFNDALLALYRAGTIHYETGRAHATNPDEFSLSARGMTTGVAMFRSGPGDEARGGWDMKALLRHADERNASDLHVTVGRPPMLRIDGHLVPLDEAPLSAADMRMLLFSILSTAQRTTYEMEREIDFALAIEDGRRFRVNAYWQKGRMAASLRRIASIIPSAEALGLPRSVTFLGDRPHGLLLVVGPTGSGKSTTLACLVDRINHTRACRIITVEDPIEFIHESAIATVDQREVHADTKSFSAALKYVLRQDPEVILVGEMRDLETIQAALTAAETGHLVLATLHTNDAVQAIDRIIDVFPPHQQHQIRAQLSSSLLGVVSQRLLPRIGGGRVGAFEVMVANTAIRAMIRDAKMHQAQSIMEASLGDGMVTMDRALQELYRGGAVDYEQALRYVRNPRSL